MQRFLLISILVAGLFGASAQAQANEVSRTIAQNLRVLFFCNDADADSMLASACGYIDWIHKQENPADLPSLGSLYNNNAPEAKQQAYMRCSGLLHMLAEQHLNARCRGLVNQASQSGVSMFKGAIDLEWAATAEFAKAQNLSMNPLGLVDVLETQITPAVRNYSAMYDGQLRLDYNADGQPIGTSNFMSQELSNCLSMARTVEDFPEKQFGINIKIKQ